MALTSNLPLEYQNQPYFLPFDVFLETISGFFIDLGSKAVWLVDSVDCRVNIKAICYIVAVVLRKMGFWAECDKERRGMDGLNSGLTKNAKMSELKWLEKWHEIRSPRVKK